MAQKNQVPHASESVEQIYLFRWAVLQECVYPELELMYHIPNGGYRNKAEAARLKMEGVKPGVPDICLPVARGGYHGLYIEMKVKGNTTSEAQKRWIRLLKAQDYFVIVCYGQEEAIQVIVNYLKQKGVERYESNINNEF